MNVFDFFGRRPIEQRFPSIAAMERAAVRRIPKFASDYMVGGIGREVGRDRNIAELDKVRFTPRYVIDYETPPDITSKIFGKTWAAPFGPGPVGLTGLMWPRAQIHIARAAAEHKVPIGLSTYGTETIEDAAATAGESLWFQLYPIENIDIEQDIIARYRAVGGDVLLVTVDIPQSTRRERDLGNGLAVPPRQDVITYWQAATHPRWALETLRHGTPKFKTVLRYVPPGTPAQSSMQMLGSLSAGHVGPERLRRYRDEWKGKLVVKGVLHPDDVRMCLDMGVDGIVVSNHGGRQLDGAITAPEVLPQIRQLVGGRMAILADGGVRTGLDIARMLALGADHVLLGRALTFAVAAAGPKGPALALQILKEEFANVISQVGCQDWRDLAKFLAD